MVDYSYKTDQELVTFLQGADREAFDEIYARYWKKLLFYAGKVIRDQEDAQDIVQEIFIALWRQKDNETIIRSLSSYLHSAVRYKGFSYIRANYNKNNYISSIAHYFEEGSDTLNQQFDAKELEAIIHQEIDNLPPKMREVFILSRIEQLSYKEIAEQLNISEETVKKQIHRSLKHFKLMIDKRSGEILIFIIASFFLD